MSMTMPDAAMSDAETAHPAWCDRAQCEPDGDAVAHWSRPVTWRMQGEDVEVTMRRRQTGLDGEMLVELRLASDAFVEEPVTLLLTERDVDQVITSVLTLRLWG